MILVHRNIKRCRHHLLSKPTEEWQFAVDVSMEVILFKRKPEFQFLSMQPTTQETQGFEIQQHPPASVRNLSLMLTWIDMTPPHALQTEQQERILYKPQNCMQLLYQIPIQSCKNYSSFFSKSDLPFYYIYATSASIKDYSWDLAAALCRQWKGNLPIFSSMQHLNHFVNLLKYSRTISPTHAVFVGTYSEVKQHFFARVI